MPAKSYLFFFLGVAFTSMSLHYFVFRQLRRTLRKDFGARAKTLTRAAAAVFIIMESPFLLLFLRKQITADPVIYTKFLFYPFTIWQGIMLMWVAILVPQVLYRKLRGRRAKSSAPAQSDADTLKPLPDDYHWSVPSIRSTSKA